MKVFNVSPHRSGTQSFHLFCQANGLRSAHWPGAEIDAACEPALGTLDDYVVWDACREHFRSADVFSDLPVPSIYGLLWQFHPNAKFVLIKRDPGAWVASVRRHFQGRGFSFLEKFFYWSILGVRADSLDAYRDEELRTAYERCCSQAATFLRDRAPFLAADLDNPALDECIAEFLGFDLKEPMEHVR